jgi:hypothetical protein
MTTDITIVCQHSTKERRRVSSDFHRQAFTEYGLSYPQPRGAFEVDHLIPLELGGDNVIANLWPEAAEPAPGFHEKDKVENYLHRQVCSGAMSLSDAQRQIETDWLKVWKQIEGQGPTTDVGRARATKLTTHPMLASSEATQRAIRAGHLTVLSNRPARAPITTIPQRYRSLPRVHRQA